MKYKIGELIHSISKTMDFKNKKKVIFLNTSDVLDGEILNNRYTNTLALPGQAKKMVKYNDILYSEIRPRNKRFALVKKKDTDNIVVSTKLMVLRNARPDILFTQYMYLFLTSPFIINYLQREAEFRSGTFPQITFKDNIANIVIDLPSLDKQIKIVRKINVFNKKITINRQINDNLALLLENMFNNLIQKHSNNAKLSDICSITNSKISVNQLTRDNYWSNTNLLPNKAGATIANKLPKVKNVNKVLAGDTLFGNIRPYFQKIFYPANNGGASTDIICFHPNSIQIREYLYSVIYSDNFIFSVVKSAKGTKMPRGDKAQMMNYKIYLPTEKELLIFHSQAKKILLLKQINNQENKTLQILKKCLLQKYF